MFVWGVVKRRVLKISIVLYWQPPDLLIFLTDPHFFPDFFHIWQVAWYASLSNQSCP